MKATIAIVGGGVSGSLTAIQLLRSSTAHLDIHLIEGSGIFGAGVAYGTTEYSSLLNVPAGKMSAFPDDPKHFLRWLQSTHFYTELGHSASETSFIPRNVYGRYIGETLDAAEHAANPLIRLIRHNDVVIDIQALAEEAVLYLQSGDYIHADKVVIALGNFPPSDLPFIDQVVCSSHRYIKNPWSPQAFDLISPNDNVLIIGTGLTMVDMVLGLHVRGHRGNVFAVSKHGLLPQTHRLSTNTVLTPNIAELPNTARQLMRYIRQHIETSARTELLDWRVIFDSLRSITPMLWQRLPISEKRRLLRHVQPYWDIHRHRMPPEAAEIIDHLLGSGLLTIRKGCIERIEMVEQHIRANIKTCQKERLVLDVKHVINCTGPNTRYLTLNNPLLNQLFKRELAQPDCLELGLDADNTGALLDREGQSSSLIYTIGPTLKGILWETTAVPEIRQQAVRLGETLLKTLKFDVSERAGNYL